MKARITFILDEHADFDPKQINVSQQSLSVAQLPVAIREDRVAFSIDEVQREIATALKQTHEVHLRWQSPEFTEAITPYSSRVAPGLHVFYTPSKRPDADISKLFKRSPTVTHINANRVSDASVLCPTLKHLFNLELDCTSPNKTFVQAPVVSSRFATASSQQYFSLLPSLERLAAHTALNICEDKSWSSKSGCVHMSAALKSADAMDADYDAISSTLTLRIYRRKPSTESVLWSEIKPASGTSVEVGVLSQQDAAPGDAGPEKISMGGYITQVGEDSKASPTLFSFPSRHHPISSPYKVSFNKPTGLHPTLRISFPSGTPKPQDAHSPDSCRLHAYLTLPKHIFPDKYQLAAPNFLKANGLKQIHSLTMPPPDLEAPDWAVTSWGSNMLMELDPSASSTSSDTAWQAEIPLHLRYLKPVEGGIRVADVPWPVLFWACSSDEGGAKMSVNPFDRTDLGYDGAFGTRTVFYHLHSSPETGLVEHISVPVLDDTAAGFGYLRSGTAAVLIFGLVWVLWKLVYVSITRKEAGSLLQAAHREKKAQ